MWRRDFGKVYQALHNGKKVAVKIFKEDSKTLTTPKGSLRQGNPKKELEMLTASKAFSNVLQILGWGTYLSDRLFIVTELHQPLKVQPFDLVGIQKVSQGLFKGINELHRRKIIHTDVNPRNCLINAEGGGVLADLGSATYFDEERFWPVQTVWYRDPRVFIDAPWDHTIDLWAMGCTLFEFAIGKPLFNGATDEKHPDADFIRELHTLHLIAQLLGKPRQHLHLRSGAKCERYFYYYDLSLRALPSAYLFDDQKHTFDSLRATCCNHGADASSAGHFVSLIGKLVTYGDKISAADALQSPFFAENNTS